LPGARLQRNADKTEVMWFGSAAKLSKIPPASSSIRIGFIDVQPVTVVQGLGVMISVDLSMRVHVSRTAQMLLPSASPAVHPSAAWSRRHGMARVSLRLVEIAVFAGLPASTLALFQRVLHVAARLVLNLWPRDHVSAALRELHWLPVSQRIDYKLCLLVHKSHVVKRQSTSATC